MSNDNNDGEWARYAKLESTIGQLLLDGRRRVRDINDLLQGFVSDPRWAVGANESYPVVTAPPTPKFELLVDLGEIVVPEGYSAQWLADFAKRYGKGKGFRYIDPAITDQNFANPSRILKPGDRLGVQAFRQAAPGMTTSEERLTFLATQNAVLTGAQGAALVWEQKRDLLLRGKWYLSMDEKNRLPFVDGRHWVPGVHVRSGGGFGFCLGSFGGPWDGGSALFCFRDLTQPSGA